MKKLIFCVFAIIFFCSIFTVSVNAKETDNSRSMIDEYTSDILDALDKDSREILESFGLEDVSAKGIFDLSFADILKSIVNIFKLSIKSQLSSFLKMLGMLIILIAVNGFRDDTFVGKELLTDVFTMICIAGIASVINQSLSDLVIAFNMTSTLLMLYIPIIAVLLSATGNVTSSILYNSSIVALSQVMSFVADKIIIPFISVYFAFVIALSLNESIYSDKIIAFANKLVVTVISSATMLFTLIISAKNTLAGDMDGIIYKSGKYFIANFIPIVGPTISSILGSVIGSISLVKSTVSILLILCVFAVNFPVIIKLFTSYLSLHIIGIISDSFGERQVGGIFYNFASGIRILMVLVIFELVLIVISTALVISVKGEI